MSTPKENVNALDAALCRGDGQLDLYVTYQDGSCVASMYVGDDADEVAQACAATLEDALAGVRAGLGAAVREAVSTS